MYWLIPLIQVAPLHAIKAGESSGCRTERTVSLHSWMEVNSFIPRPLYCRVKIPQLSLNRRLGILRADLDAVTLGNPTIIRRSYSPFFGAAVSSRPGSPHYWGFTITLRHTTVGRTPLDEWSARRRDFYLTTTLTRDRQLCPRRDSNPHSQQANGLRPTP